MSESTLTRSRSRDNSNQKSDWLDLTYIHCFQESNLLIPKATLRENEGKLEPENNNCYMKEKRFIVQHILKKRKTHLFDWREA